MTLIAVIGDGPIFQVYSHSKESYLTLHDGTPRLIMTTKSLRLSGMAPQQFKSSLNYKKVSSPHDKADVI